MGDHSPSEIISSVLPRVLIVSRRTVRKNKFVDFVGEYHLDLIVKYGAVPVIVPRVAGVNLLLDSFEPIHGVLLCEGEDIDPSLYENDLSGLSSQELEEIRSLHSSDTAIDRAKDSIELQLARRCLEKNIPYMGICRGSQVLNVACGGTLYQDVERELSKKPGVKVMHMDYGNYDGHRHPVQVVKETPLHAWFQESLKGDSMQEILVNSYHHQGVKRLAERFRPMAYAPDGLIEAFYDPAVYNPEEGKFIMGLQFHPERMQHNDQDASCTENASESTVFDYPGCPCAYQEFVKAVVAYKKKLIASTKQREVSVKVDGETEKQRKRIVRSFSIAKLVYQDYNTYKQSIDTAVNSDLEPGASFLQFNTAFDIPHLSGALSAEEEKRLKKMGATVRNSGSYLENFLHMNKKEKERKVAARKLMRTMATHQLSELLDFYGVMLQIGAEVLEEKINASSEREMSTIF